MLHSYIEVDIYLAVTEQPPSCNKYNGSETGYGIMTRKKYCFPIIIYLWRTTIWRWPHG